jgi:hypothetical protein
MLGGLWGSRVADALRWLVEFIRRASFPNQAGKKPAEDTVDFVRHKCLVGGDKSWAFVPQVIQTIRHLAGDGHVILVGHGAMMVTANRMNVYPVRLTGSPCLHLR